MADEQANKIVVISPKLHRRLKIFAAKENKTMQELTEIAIKTLLDARKEGK